MRKKRITKRVVGLQTRQITDLLRLADEEGSNVSVLIRTFVREGLARWKRAGELLGMKPF